MKATVAEDSIASGGDCDNDVNIKLNPPAALRLNMEFENLCYEVRSPGFKTQTKQILKNVSGRFCAGQLTAIMGPSGAGKSTLLNILAGYDATGVTGAIRINGTLRNMKQFKKVSTYIMQDDLLQQRITVREAMVYAAKLKLGTHLSRDEIDARIMDIVDELGLKVCIDTRTERLSGGQRKRLAVALELVSNPPIIFLDEPTSGLDTVAIKQCVELLKALSQQGRTVVCTIHQPPDNILKLFDSVYFMSEGNCIYRGPVPNIVPYLSTVGLPCPTSYNPAEYLIEVATKENMKLFKNAIGSYSSETKIRQIYDNGHVYNYNMFEAEKNNNNDSLNDFEFASSFFSQFILLLGRMFLQMRRDSIFMYIQAFHHVVSGALMGGLFFGIAPDGSQTLANFKFCLSVMVFFAYTHTMTSILLFPLEISLLKREYFNRWYSLKAYYCAMTISSVPLLVSSAMVFITITYFMTSQPLDVTRFVLFSIMCILTAFAAQALGLLVGSIFNIKLGCIIGPAISSPLLIFTIYGMGFGHQIEPLMRLVMNVSYMRFAASGLLDAVMGGLPTLPCPDDELYCHYADPETLMRDMGMAGTNYGIQALGICIIIVTYRALTYGVLRLRVSNNGGSGYLSSIAKMFD